MGKKGEELWDDSALINAFDRAIASYKVMHGKGGQESPSAEGEAISSAEQNSDDLISERNVESKRDLETGDMNNVASTTEVEETINPLPVKGSAADDNGTTHNINSSNGQIVDNSYPDTHVEDYNHLLSQYYEVEEQRQKILQQLYHYGESSTWNYQGTDSSVPWGTSSASQENQVPVQSSVPTNYTAQLGTSASQDHQVPIPQLSCSTVACSCCSYACPLSTSNGTCIGIFGNDTSAAGQNGLSVEKDDLVKTAMGAADRALSWMKTSAFGGANTIDSEGKEKKLETDAGELAQSCSSETDLSVVFKAWYTAGFYTCKYLMEQSAAKK